MGYEHKDSGYIYERFLHYWCFGVSLEWIACGESECSEGIMAWIRQWASLPAIAMHSSSQHLRLSKWD
jgi:hypothetical protein